MKKILLIVIIFLQVMLLSQMTFGESLDEINDQYNKEYEALKPPSGSSSVRTDYVFEQTALSTMQTTRLLKLIYEQNREILSRYDNALNKYDEIIRQNNEIIKLLSKDVSKDEEKK
jgi:hypothetical protein